MVYKIGQVFKSDNKYYLLSEVYYNRCALINIFTGKFWETPVEVDNVDKITQQELYKIINSDDDFELDTVYSRIR